MFVQNLPTGKTSVEYGEPKPYQSPVRVTSVSPDVIIYSDAESGKDIGKVYRTTNRWWVDAVTIVNPIEIPDKYIGFLFIRQVYIALKNNEL